MSLVPREGNLAESERLEARLVRLTGYRDRTRVRGAAKRPIPARPGSYCTVPACGDICRCWPGETSVGVHLASGGFLGPPSTVSPDQFRHSGPRVPVVAAVSFRSVPDEISEHPVPAIQIFQRKDEFKEILTG